VLVGMSTINRSDNQVKSAIETSIVANYGDRPGVKTTISDDRRRP